MNTSLNFRFSIYLVTLTIFIVVSLSAILLLQFKNSIAVLTEENSILFSEKLQESHFQLGESIVTSLSEDLINPIYQLDMQSIHDLLAPVLRNENVVSIIVYDELGKIIHDGKEEIPRYGELVPNQKTLDGIRAHDQLVRQLENDGNIISVSKPIWIGDQPLGGVKVRMALAGVLHDLEKMWQNQKKIEEKDMFTMLVSALITALIFVLLSIVVSVMLARLLAKPIQDLADQAIKIGQGKLEFYMPVSKGKEMSILANAFNEMCINIAKYQDRIHALAFHDSLTGLPNRNMFQEFLQQTLKHARRNNEKFAVLYLDLDDFKRINDSMGHDAGDSILCNVANRLQATLRDEDYIGKVITNKPEDLIARLGGDEFIIIISNIKSRCDASVAAERVIQSLNDPFDINGQQCYVTFSIGITLYPIDGDDSDVLIKNSDIAMYESKKAGKNTYRFFSQATNDRILNKFTIESKLHKAIENNEFYLYYQPIVNVHTNEVSGLEALIRWDTMNAKLNSPSAFIPIAEETGLIIPIEEWVIDKVCKQIRTWQQKGISPIPVSINISHNHFSNEGLCDFLSKCIIGNDIDPKSLVLELTETAIMKNFDITNNALMRIKKLGVKIALDDFGAGYSSFDLLRKFPIDILKIDKSFIDEVTDKDHHGKIISAMITMGHSLDMDVIVEGIEQTVQLQYLQLSQCDHAQGFLLGEPMSIDKLEKNILRQPQQLP